MGFLSEYWHRLAAGMGGRIGRKAATPSQVASLELELLELSASHQALAGNLERIRSDFERRWSAGFKLLNELEQTCRQTEAARLAEGGRLDRLEQLLSDIETGQNRAGSELARLENSLTEAAQRLETRHSQLKFLQDSAREQHQALKTQLAETASRLETRDAEQAEGLATVAARIQAVETAQAENGNRFADAERTAGELQAALAEQTRRIDAFLDSVSARVEANDGRVQALENVLENLQRQQHSRFEEIQTLLHRQQTVTNRILALLAIALLLAGVLGAVLVAGGGG